MDCLLMLDCKDAMWTVKGPHFVAFMAILGTNEDVEREIDRVTSTTGSALPGRAKRTSAHFAFERS